MPKLNIQKAVKIQELISNQANPQLKKRGITKEDFEEFKHLEAEIEKTKIQL